MLIRSQDKKSITPLCEILIVPIRSHVQRKEYRTIGYKIVTCENLEIGRYSTEEKAIKVLDMIQSAYNSIETMKIDKQAWRDNHYFEMPQDSEI